MAILEVNHIKKSFGKVEVLKGIDFSLEKGEVLAIIGSSGSGKTTLLRCLNFLERADEGTISVGGEVIFDATDAKTENEAVTRRKRLHFGLVFQSFNLSISHPKFFGQKYCISSYFVLNLRQHSDGIGSPSVTREQCSRIEPLILSAIHM